jgi:hypothetical protein
VNSTYLPPQVRALDGAAQAKRTLDAVLDTADQMQNLRTAIAAYYEAVANDAENEGWVWHRHWLWLFYNI